MIKIISKCLMILSLFFSQLSFAMNWQGRSFLAITSTAFSFNFDRSVNQSISNWDHSPGALNTSMHYTERYAGLVVPVVSLLSYPLFSIANEPSDPATKISRELFYSALLYTGVSWIGKFTIGRHRPNAYDGPREFSPFSSNSAFPSGHTGIAFAFATSLSLNIPSTPLKATLFTMAGLTGLSRMYHNKHWISDTVAGAWLGGFSALFVHEHLFHHGQASQKNRRWNMVPLIGQNQLGIVVTAIMP